MRVFRSWRVAGTQLFTELFGGMIRAAADAEPVVTLVYSAAPVPQLEQGNQHVMTVTDAVAHVIGAPLFGGAAMSATNPGTGMVWTLTVRNASGGAAGALTFNAVFKIAGAWVATATGFSRSITFRWNGTNHVELYRGAADVSN